MKIVFPQLAVAGLLAIALISLRLATTGKYVPTSVAVYVLLWVVPVAAFALIVMLRRAKR
jgi:hypothetical protein